MFSCEFCEISKNTFFKENLRWLFLFIDTYLLKDENKNTKIALIDVNQSRIYRSKSTLETPIQ